MPQSWIPLLKAIKISPPFNFTPNSKVTRPIRTSCSEIHQFAGTGSGAGFRIAVVEKGLAEHCSANGQQLIFGHGTRFSQEQTQELWQGKLSTWTMQRRRLATSDKLHVIIIVAVGVVTLDVTALNFNRLHV
jgi:hypothetical protein